MGWGSWGYAYRNVREVTHIPGGGGIAVRATDMLRFGYLLLREGRWNDAQLVPAEYVRRSARQSRDNPHYPYSLQFNINSNGEIPELPRDAFAQFVGDVALPELAAAGQVRGWHR